MANELKKMKEIHAQRIVNDICAEMEMIYTRLCALQTQAIYNEIKPCAARRVYTKEMERVHRLSHFMELIQMKYRDINSTIDLVAFGRFMTFWSEL